MRRAAFAMVLALLLAGCSGDRADDARGGPSPTASPSPPPLDKYSYRGTQCSELGLQVPVAASNVRPHVPSRYRLTGEAQGRAVLAFAFAKCERMVPLDASTPSSVLQVDLAVMIEGGGFYQIAYTTSSAPIHENASRVAFPAVHTPTATMTTFPFQGADLVQAHVRGGNVSLDVAATAGRGPASSTAGGVYYHSGPNGTSRMTYDVRLASVGPAAGRITAESGSLPARLFGASAVDGVGFYATFALGANLTRLPD